MPERYFEDFTLMEKHLQPDYLGSERVSFSPILVFRGALTHTAGEEVSMAGRITLRSDPVLLHEYDVTLAPGDHVRREKDGALYRVAGRSDDMRTPSFSGLSFAQVPVERLVIPC